MVLIYEFVLVYEFIPMKPLNPPDVVPHASKPQVGLPPPFVEGEPDCRLVIYN